MANTWHTCTGTLLHLHRNSPAAVNDQIYDYIGESEARSDWKAFQMSLATLLGPSKFSRCTKKTSETDSCPSNLGKIFLSFLKIRNIPSGSFWHEVSSSINRTPWLVAGAPLCHSLTSSDFPHPDSRSGSRQSASTFTTRFRRSSRNAELRSVPYCVRSHCHECCPYISAHVMSGHKCLSCDDEIVSWALIVFRVNTHARAYKCVEKTI